MRLDLESVIKPGPIALSTPSGEPTRRMQIRRWLAALGIARKEVMGEGELLVYSKGLEGFSDGPITRVINRLSTSPREEYEPKIPELGDFRAMVRSEAWKDNPYVPCGHCCSGMIG